VLTKFTFKPRAQKELDFFHKKDSEKVAKIYKLIESILENHLTNPYAGIGKPEALKHQLKGCWSRHINKEHRLVYKIENNELIILSCKYHYTE